MLLAMKDARMNDEKTKQERKIQTTKEGKKDSLKRKEK
jgi:hypothetical protein